MKPHLDISEVARSIELYNLGRQLERESNGDNICLEHIREPYLRKREDVASLVVAFGSYDPLSIAHETLFLRGLKMAREDSSKKGYWELLIVTSTSHFDKEIDFKKNSAIYDRIHALEGFASCQGNVSLALFNDPLFIELAEAIEEVYGSRTDIYFVVGSDVMEKIVDLEGYRSRGLDGEKVLARLFQHKFIVSDRKIETKKGKPVVGARELAAEYEILNDYREQILAIDLQDHYEDLRIPIESVSSTLIRNKRRQKANTRDLEAVGISDFIDKRGLYLEDNLRYVAFTYARERFAQENEGQPIATYIRELMAYLERLYGDKDLQRKEVKRYEKIRDSDPARGED